MRGAGLGAGVGGMSGEEERLAANPHARAPGRPPWARTHTHGHMGGRERGRGRARKSRPLKTRPWPRRRALFVTTSSPHPHTQEPDSMLARMFGGDLPSRRDDQVGREGREKGAEVGRPRSLRLRTRWRKKTPGPTNPFLPFPTPGPRLHRPRPQTLPPHPQLAARRRRHPALLRRRPAGGGAGG